MTQSSQPLFDLIFRGDILPGHQLPEVKAKLAQLFKTDVVKINALFSGAAVQLKRNLDQATAEKYQTVLRKAGAAVQLAEAGKVRTAPVAASREPKTAPVAPPTALQPRSDLQESAAAKRDAASAATPGQQAAPATAGATPAPVGSPVPAPVAAATEPTGLSLAPVGADLREGQEKPHVETPAVDVSQITMRPPGADLLDDSERPVVKAVAVRGENYGLSELGADLLHDSEKSPAAAIRIDLPDVDLAPVGADMGQLKRDIPVVTPDISGLSLKEN